MAGKGKAGAGASTEGHVKSETRPGQGDISNAPAVDSNQDEGSVKAAKEAGRKPVNGQSKAAERKKRKEAVIYTSDVYTGKSTCIWSCGLVPFVIMPRPFIVMVNSPSWCSDIVQLP